MLSLAGRLVATVSLAAVVSGCAVLGAAREATVPPLEVPAPPPRVVSAFPEDVPAELPAVVVDVPPAEVVRIEPETEPEPAPERDEPTAPAPLAEVSPEASPDSPQLRPAPALDVATESVRLSLLSTERALEGIDRTTLDTAGRAQHDTARRLHNQAKAALQAGNALFAHYLNEKVETLARDLQDR